MRSSINEKNVKSICVSIIVPVYNVEQYLDKCLESLLNQTLQNIEIILIDDGSTDNSLYKCREYEKKDKRISAYTKENEGLGLTRNYGIEKAKGEYIAFVDSDDFISLDFYERLYNKAKEENLESCFGNMKVYMNDEHIVDSDCIPFKKDVIPAKKLLYNMLRVEDKSDYKKSYMGMSSCRAIYRLDVIKDKFKFESERKYISEDLLYNMEFLMRTNKVGFVENVYYFYRQNLNSISKKYNKDKFSKSLVFFEELIKRTKKYGIYQETKKGIFCLFSSYVRNCIKQEVLINKVSKKERKDNIKKIVRNKQVRKMIKISGCEDLKKSFINFCIKYKLIGLLWISYKKMNKEN